MAFLGSEAEVLSAANHDLRRDFWPLSADETFFSLEEYSGEPFSAIALDAVSLSVCFLAKKHPRFQAPQGVRAARARCFPTWSRGGTIVDMDYEIVHASNRKTRVRASMDKTSETRYAFRVTSGSALLHLVFVYGREDITDGPNVIETHILRGQNVHRSLA